MCGGVVSAVSSSSRGVLYVILLVTIWYTALESEAQYRTLPRRNPYPCQGGLLRRGCPRIYMPICGTDGVVYSNTCYMEAAMCADRTLDVCVITSGECNDRPCATSVGRTGMASTENDDYNAANSENNYYDNEIARNEKKVESRWITVGRK